MNPRSSFETKVLAAFAAAAWVVAALFAATWKLAGDASDATRLVAHTHEVLGKLSRIRGDTLQIELSTQNFRVTGDSKHLLDRDAKTAEREGLVDELRRLVADNPTQKARWEGLRAVLNERIAISRQVETLRKTQGAEAANAFVASAPLRETRERTYRLMGAMEEDENQLLARRSDEQSRARQVMIGVGAAVSVLLFALLLASYGLIRRQLRETWASQRALADSEESLATTLHSIGDAVLATDRQGRITRMNPVAERLTGWTLAQALGQPVDVVFRIINEETRAPAVVPVAKVLATGQVQDLANHTALIARDGSECPIADSAAPIRDTAGNITGVVLVFHDETLPRQAQRLVREQNALLEQRVQERTAQLHASEDHMRSVMRNVPAMIAYVDAQQRYVYVNEQYQQRFTPERADITGCSVREILGDTRYAIAAPLIERVLQGQPQNYDWQPFPDVWHSIHYVPKLDTHGRVVGYYVLGNDITQRKHAEEKIQSLNHALEQHVHELEHVTRALKTLSAGNRTMLRATDEQSLLDSMCEAIVAAGGYGMAVVWYVDGDIRKPLRPMAQCGYPPGPETLRMLQSTWTDDAHGHSAIANAIRTGQSCVLQAVLGNTNSTPWRRMGDSTSSIACPIRVEGKAIGALVIYDVQAETFDSDEVDLLTESADDLAFGIATLRARTAQQAIQDTMYRLTRNDPLTGLPNQAHFTELLTAAIDTSTQQQQAFAVLQTNIERLSEINDALGFSHGDEMLREFARRLTATAPAQAHTARLRGDEFAVLLPHCNAHAALDFVRQLEEAIAKPFPVADISLHVSATIGISLFPDHGSTAHDMYRHMDIAVHQAKKRGVQHVVFDPAQSPDQSHRLNMAGELQRAIQSGDLRLYLQPKVEFSTGQVCGAEGLVRWQHPERGLIPPGEFIALAEHTGLIQPLTEWVIETAMRQTQEWERQSQPLPIAVNLSARNLRDERLLEKIRLWQTTLGTQASWLELEITESAVMEDAELALRVLYSLREHGISLYIDDFGTGYSSLSYLQKLPVEYIKIDQSFVRDMSVNKDSAAIVRSTIDLVHDLGRKVVAEGVETRAQWDQLEALGCDIAQGYLIAKPMPAEEFLGWLAHYQAQQRGLGPTHLPI